MQAADVRHDPTIAAEVARFLRQHGAKESVTSDRIIGCPHEEGVDYPMGRTCPRCPFWTGIDRFTHEPLKPPAPTMSPADVLEDLSADRSVQPREALESTDGHRDAILEPLLRAVDRGIDEPKGASPMEATLFAYALYLLAKWREPRAYPHVLRWLTLPGEGAFEIAGDVVTQDGGRILAAVCDGDLEPIKALVVNCQQDSKFPPGQDVNFPPLPVLSYCPGVQGAGSPLVGVEGQKAPRGVWGNAPPPSAHDVVFSFCRTPPFSPPASLLSRTGFWGVSRS